MSDVSLNLAESETSFFLFLGIDPLLNTSFAGRRIFSWAASKAFQTKSKAENRDRYFFLYCSLHFSPLSLGVGVVF